MNSETNRYKDNWYWWKIIPFDVVAKKINKGSKGNAFKLLRTKITTRQKLCILLRRGTWEYFFETYIEPMLSYVYKDIKKVINDNKENIEGDSIISNYHVLEPYTVPEWLNYQHPEQDQTG